MFIGLFMLCGSLKWKWNPNKNATRERDPFTHWRLALKQQSVGAELPARLHCIAQALAT